MTKKKSMFNTEKGRRIERRKCGVDTVIRGYTIIIQPAPYRKLDTSICNIVRSIFVYEEKNMIIYIND